MSGQRIQYWLPEQFVTDEDLNAAEPLETSGRLIYLSSAAECEAESWIQWKKSRSETEKLRIVSLPTPKSSPSRMMTNRTKFQECRM